MFKKILSPATIFLFTIIIIAAFFRLYNITQTPPGLYPDEAINGNNALEAISTNNWKVFYPENNGREGLFINIQAFSVMIFGNYPWALRGVSAIFGIFTVLGIYFLTKKLFENYGIRKFNKNSKLKIENSEIIALLSAFLLATSFWHINFSRIGFRAIMAPMFLTWGIYFLLKLLNQQKNNWKLAAIGGLIYGLGFHSYIAYRATPALVVFIAFLYWLKNKDSAIRKKIIVSTLIFSIFAVIAFIPLGIYFINHPADFFGRTTQVSVFNSPSPIKALSENIIKTLGMFNFSGDWNWRHNYAGASELSWPVGIMFLTGIFFIVFHLFKNFFIDKFSENFKLKIENSLPFLIILFWFAVAALPVVISNEGIPHALRAILMIPPVIIIAAFGGIIAYEKLNKIFNSEKSKFFLRLMSYVLYLILIISAYKSYFIDWAKNPNTAGAFAQDYVVIGKQLNSLPKNLPKYVVVKANGADVRGLPMPTQTTMFITDTFTPEKQKEKNIFYILPNQTNQIPANAFIVELK